MKEISEGTVTLQVSVHIRDHQDRPLLSSAPAPLTVNQRHLRSTLRHLMLGVCAQLDRIAPQASSGCEAVDALDTIELTDEDIEWMNASLGPKPK